MYICICIYIYISYYIYIYIILYILYYMYIYIILFIYYIILYYIILHYIILHYIILYYIYIYVLYICILYIHVHTQYIYAYDCACSSCSLLLQPTRLLLRTSNGWSSQNPHAPRASPPSLQPPVINRSVTLQAWDNEGRSKAKAGTTRVKKLGLS